MAQRKFKINKLRELHAAIGNLIDESDASAAKAADEDDDEPQGADAPESAQAKLAAGHRAHDSAHRRAGDVLSMSEAFPGFDRNRPKY
jgi:hypothetical protein